MEDSETEAAETDPLVKQSGDNRLQTAGGGEGDGGARRWTGGARKPARHHPDGRPRLSLVPETCEKSTEEEADQHKEDSEEKGGSKKTAESPTPLCPFFGVRNYLHHFYEKQDISNPALYEDVPLVSDRACKCGPFAQGLCGGGPRLSLHAVMRTNSHLMLKISLYVCSIQFIGEFELKLKV